MNILIKVFGCTANQSDASIAGYLLKKDRKYQIVNNIDEADIVILFTCTVISATEQRMVSLINDIIKQKKRLIVTGCMASIQSEVIKNIDHDILCIAPQQIHHLLTLLGSSSDDETNIEKYMVNKDYSGIIAPIAIS